MGLINGDYLPEGASVIGEFATLIIKVGEVASSLQPPARERVAPPKKSEFANSPRNKAGSDCLSPPTRLERIRFCCGMCPINSADFWSTRRDSRWLGP